jgi:hypothetical protein
VTKDPRMLRIGERFLDDQRTALGGGAGERMTAVA